MCIVVAPAVMMGIMAATAAASVAVSMAAASAQADASSKQMQYQAAVAENNAKISQVQAGLAQDAGQTAEQEQRMKTAALIGHSRAIAGASGTDPNSGSNLDVIESEAQTGELDALTIKSNTARQVYGYEVQGMSDHAQAQLDMAGAGFAQSQGQWAMLSSVVGGASSFAGKWGDWQMSSRLTNAMASSPAMR